MIGLIAWVILGFVGGLVCLSIDDWNMDWLDDVALLWGIIACIVLGPILPGGMIFLSWWGKKYSPSYIFHKG